MNKLFQRMFLSFFIFVSAVCCFAQEKPPLTAADLEKNTRYFEIVDNKLVGDGAQFLTDEVKQSQYVLLGEYHRSLRISEFTKAIIPVYHDAGCRTFGLEIGPVSAEILSEMSSGSSRTLPNLKDFNSNYGVAVKSRTLTPIPFFGAVEDAEFLIEARRRNWNLLGLDQEFAFGYLPLIKRMYENLKSKKQTELKPLYEQVINSIKTFYEADINEGKN